MENIHIMTSIDSKNIYQFLVEEISGTYSKSKTHVNQMINRGIVETYWKIGRHIVEFEQGGENKAKYGSGLLERLSKDLKNLHGKGFSRSNLSYMRLVYLSYPICEEVPHKLTWNPSRFALKEKSNNPILNPKGTP